MALTIPVQMLERNPDAWAAIKAIPGVRYAARRFSVPFDALGAVKAEAARYGVRLNFASPRTLPAPAPLDPQAISGLRPGRAEWLTEYQREAVDAFRARPGLMLFHAAGAGKSIASIACAQQHPAGRVVVVTLATHKRFWKREIDHLTDAGAQIIDGVTPILPPPEGSGPRFLVLNWEILAAHVDALCQLEGGIGVVIFDEVHRAKDARGKWTKAAWTISRSAKRVLGLTASPIPDRVRDLWGQIDLVSRGAFGSFWDFARRYCDAKEASHPGGSHLDTSGSSNLPELRQRWDHYCHRVKAERSHAALPPIRRVVHYLPVADLLADRGKTEVAKSEGGRAASWFEAKLAKAAARKRPQVVALCEEVAGNGGKVVVLTGRHKDVETIAAAVESRIDGVKVWGIHGGNSTGLEVDAAVTAYMAAEGKAVLVGTAELIGTGKNLQDTDALIMAMLPWNQGQVEQREGRVFRLGMKRRPVVHYLIAEGTVDERVAEVLLGKLPAYGEAVGEAGALDLADALKGLDDEDEVLAMLVRHTIDAGVTA